MDKNNGIILISNMKIKENQKTKKKKIQTMITLIFLQTTMYKTINLIFQNKIKRNHNKMNF